MNSGARARGNWCRPGAPKSKYSPEGASYGTSFTFEQQDEVLERAIATAKAFGTNKVRLFDFWRLENDKPYRDAMDAKATEVSSLHQHVIGRRRIPKAGYRISDWVLRHVVLLHRWLR